MKTPELTGAALDWAVAKCEGAYSVSVDTDIDGTKRVNYGGMYPEWSTDWAHGGPIIERENIGLWSEGYDWEAKIQTGVGEWLDMWDASPLIAAMRCYVVSKLGDDIELPEELK
jgi:hypothetical protein